MALIKSLKNNKQNNIATKAVLLLYTDGKREKNYKTISFIKPGTLPLSVVVLF